MIDIQPNIISRNITVVLNRAEIHKGSQMQRLIDAQLTLDPYFFNASAGTAL